MTLLSGRLVLNPFLQRGCFSLIHQWRPLDLRLVLLVFVSVLFCLPGPRDRLRLATNVLSRSSPSILLLALCTSCAIRVCIVVFQILFCIRVTRRLMGFTRLHFCVRVVLTLVSSLAIYTSSISAPGLYSSGLYSSATVALSAAQLLFLRHVLRLRVYLMLLFLM